MTVRTGEHSTLQGIYIIHRIADKLSPIERFSESFYLEFIYVSKQKIPPWSGQHCQRSERAASLFLDAGNWVRLQYYIGGRFPGRHATPQVYCPWELSKSRLDRVYTSPHKYNTQGVFVRDLYLYVSVYAYRIYSTLAARADIIW